MRVTLRRATPADVPTLERWDRDPGVIAAVTDEPGAATAFEDIDWLEEIEAQSQYSEYFIAEARGRPIGAMQITDPHSEPTHYWGECAPNQRAVDIFIGTARDRGRGYGEEMMRLALMRCFADAAVTAVVIDPLASNTRAHAFYRRLGFVPVERRQFGHSDCLVHRLGREAWRARFPEDAGGG